jgi:hypothetical protein
VLSADDKEKSTMKWNSPWAAPLLCALALQAHAGSFSKCSDEAGVVAYRSRACLPGETLVATLDPVPETRAPGHEDGPRSARRSTPARKTVRHGRTRATRSRPRSTRKPRANRNPCASAKKARDDFQRRRGIKVTMDELSRWNHRVYDACK